MATERAIAALPTAVRIGPYRYAIGTDAEAAYDYSFFGVCLNNSRRIKLDPRQSDTELPQTLLHEVLHAIGSVHEIAELRAHKTDTNGHTTDQIDLMATAILTFLRSNPEITQYLMAQENA